MLRVSTTLADKGWRHDHQFTGPAVTVQLTVPDIHAKLEHVDSQQFFQLKKKRKIVDLDSPFEWHIRPKLLSLIDVWGVVFLQNLPCYLIGCVNTFLYDVCTFL